MKLKAKMNKLGKTSAEPKTYITYKKSDGMNYEVATRLSSAVDRNDFVIQLVIQEASINQELYALLESIKGFPEAVEDFKAEVKAEAEAEKKAEAKAKKI